MMRLDLARAGHAVRRGSLLLVAGLLLAITAGLPSAAPAGALGEADDLQKRVTLTPGRQRLSAMLADLSRQLGIQITADESIADDPIICHIRGRKAVSVLQGVALVMRYRIQRTDGGYRLALEPGAAEMLARYQKIRRRLEEQKQAEEEGHFLAWLRDLSDRGTVRVGDCISLRLAAEMAPEVRELVGLFSDSELESIALGLAQPTGPIPSTGTSGMDHLVFGELPAAALPPGLMGMLSNRGVTRSPGLRVGLALTGVGAAIGVRDETGLRWLEPASARIPEHEALGHSRRVRETSALQPLRAYEERAPDWVDPEQRELALPEPAAGGGNRPATFVRLGQVHQGDRQWLDWSRQSSIPVIADGFARSTFIYSNRASNPERLSPSRWARILANRFLRKYRLAGGILLARSRQGISDRAVEVAQAQLEVANRSFDRYGRLELLTLARLAAALDDEQIELLRVIPEATRMSADKVTLERYRLALRLIAGQVPADVPYDTRNWEGPMRLDAPHTRRILNFLVNTSQSRSGEAAGGGKSGPWLSLRVGDSSAEAVLTDEAGRTAIYFIPMRPRAPIRPGK